MPNVIEIHPVDPQPRLITQAVECLTDDGLIAYPTDSSYAFGWRVGNREAQDRVTQIRRTDKAHNFTMVCKDLSEIAQYAKVDNVAYRLLKAHTPGPFTFILPATREVPNWLRHPKRKTIGIRIPDHRIAHELLAALDEPLMSSTLMLPNFDLPITELDDMPEADQNRLDLLIDGGPCGPEPTTVIDMTGAVPQIARRGKRADEIEEHIER